MLNNELLFKIRENERKGFANFVSEKIGIKNTDLVGWDYIIHTILKELEKDPYFRENYVFKGGTCLVKCHLGYYRFSRDLDFAYRDSEKLQEMSRSKLKKFLNDETGKIAETLNCIARDLGLEFYYRGHNDFNNHRYFSFLIGPGWFREMIAYSPAGEKIKLEFNYAEKFAFKPNAHLDILADVSSENHPTCYSILTPESPNTPTQEENSKIFQSQYVDEPNPKRLKHTHFYHGKKQNWKLKIMRNTLSSSGIIILLGFQHTKRRKF